MYGGTPIPQEKEMRWWWGKKVCPGSQRSSGSEAELQWLLRRKSTLTKRSLLQSTMYMNLQAQEILQVGTLSGNSSSRVVLKVIPFSIRPMKALHLKLGKCSLIAPSHKLKGCPGFTSLFRKVCVQHFPQAFVSYATSLPQCWRHFWQLFKKLNDVSLANGTAMSHFNFNSCIFFCSKNPKLPWVLHVSAPAMKQPLDLKDNGSIWASDHLSGLPWENSFPVSWLKWFITA